MDYTTTTFTQPLEREQDAIEKKYEAMIKKISKTVLKAVKEKDYKGAEECAKAILFLEEAIRIRRNPITWGTNNPLIPDPGPTIFYNHTTADEAVTTKINWTDTTGNVEEYTIQEWYDKFYK